MTDQIDASELLPAITNLSLPSNRANRQQSRKPSGRVQFTSWRSTLRQDLTLGVGNADQLIVATVKQRGDHQIHRNGIWIALTQGQRQSGSVIRIFHGELGLQVAARTEHRSQQAPDQRQKHTGDDGQPKLTVHGHVFVPLI